MTRTTAKTSSTPGVVATPPFYRTFSQFLKSRYPYKVYKVTIDAGMTCPNIDGTVARGGCTYCDNTSFSPALRQGDAQISEQIESGVKFYGQRYGAEHFIAYFQTYSNTFAPIERLKSLYDHALSHPKIVGLAVGTRPDCMDEAKLRLLQGYCSTPGTDQDETSPPDGGAAVRQVPLVSLEYGMQTMWDQTARAVNRGHDHQCTVDACKMARQLAPDLHLCLHLIIGLPGESHDMIRASAEECARLAPDSVKIHHCYVYDRTRLALDWRRGEYRPLEFEEYISLAADVLERLPARTYIQRAVGEINAEGVLAPHWGRSKLQVLDAISAELSRRGTGQRGHAGSFQT